MKNQTVTLDGKVCVLKYTIEERELIEAAFPRGDGTPGSLGAMVKGNLIDTGSFRLQAHLVWLGIRHQGKAWSYARVREALIKATQNGGLGNILEAARLEILASGVLGNIVVEPEPEPEAEDEGDPGKATSEPGVE